MTWQQWRSEYLLEHAACMRFARIWSVLPDAWLLGVVK